MKNISQAWLLQMKTKLAHTNPGSESHDELSREIEHAENDAREWEEFTEWARKEHGAKINIYQVSYQGEWREPGTVFLAFSKEKGRFVPVGTREEFIEAYGRAKK